MPEPQARLGSVSPVSTAVPAEPTPPTAIARLDLRGVADPAVDLPRPPLDGAEPTDAVRDIIAAVRAGGDAALIELSERFDGCAPASLRVPDAEIRAARSLVPPEVLAGLEVAAERIDAYHRTQLRGPVVWEQDGVTITSTEVPVDSAGCYVPGGRAAYPSTVLMTAIPARVAGVERVALCVPPGPDGRVAPVTLAAAAVAGVGEVYAVGGAQAIAALAYGTETVAPVDVICGPGNRYVAIAKREVAGRVGVAAAFAGPSEVVVIADGSVDPTYAAVDVIVQAEHGPDGLAWFVTWDVEVADAVTEHIDDLVRTSARRGDIEATLGSSGYVVVVDSPEAAVAVANGIAPEHLQLMVADPEPLLDQVRHAGAVFVGPWAPASLGDYLAGPSHVLPTHGSARFASALTVSDFVRHHHRVDVTRDGLEALGPHLQVLAQAEGLEAHARSVALRLGEAPAQETAP
jgi:histidinol dehydrogenase